jgi:transaldolase
LPNPPKLPTLRNWPQRTFLVGVITNPSLFAKSGRDFIDVTREIGLKTARR